MQTDLNAGARLIFDLRRSDYINDALMSLLHWVRVPERIIFKTAAVHTLRAFEGTIPRYSSGAQLPAADISSRHRLRSSTSNQISIPWHAPLAAGVRLLLVAGPMVWKSLSGQVNPQSHYPSFDSDGRHFCLRFPSVSSMFDSYSLWLLHASCSSF